MADVLVERRSLENIADAIRTKLGTSELIKPEDFADEIMKIEPCGNYGLIEYYTDGTYTTTDFIDLTDASILNAMSGYSWSVSVGGVTIDTANLKGITLTEDVHALPSGFLGHTIRLSSVDIHEASLEAIPSMFLESSSFNGSLSLPSSITNIGGGFLWNCDVFNQSFTIPNSVTSIGGSFMLGCSRYNRPIVIPNSVTSIRDSFMMHCVSFNSSVTLSNNLVFGWDDGNFMDGCTTFNQPIVIPNSVTEIPGAFLNNCVSFNQPITIPSSVTRIRGDFLGKCNSMTSTVDFGNLSASAIDFSNYSFSTDDQLAPCYTTGITIAGANAAAIKEVLPDLSGTLEPDMSWPKYRKLLLANQEER